MADSTSKPKSKLSAFLEAVKHDDPEVLETFLQENVVDIDHKFKFGRTALWYAVAHSNVDGQPSLHTRLLLEYGANPEISDDLQRTPLHVSIESFNTEATRELLACPRVQMEAKDSLGRTAFSRAAAEGHWRAICMFLDRGADMKSRDNKGKKPKDYKMVQDILQRRLAQVPTDLIPGSEEAGWLDMHEKSQKLEFLLERMRESINSDEKEE
ncbi:ankyrin repeats (3 copies) domain-containing protein [Pochonia chlamydosporia 170]|uniref:Ankyrin repeats (3 copies) domain-containing protein n=1 Tax=Pochonia chlamydosporia 170 TaxID=1380566 RepID=A0A179FLX8_METCM|nr:ankyrin repeats (3 copies) domain-containing protein [Pochonia chlamydosporia 170]OAQ66338.1 ankyrin repeats (3 copies) domain-containing protein [Pochonia chlamydosporia 170]